MIVTSAEIFLEPEVENDKEVAASHFPDLQFRNSVAAVSPSDGNNRKGVTADDSFEGEFYREVEVGREKRPEAIQASFAVSFECIGCIIQSVAKEHADESIGQSVNRPLNGRVVDRSTALHKPAAKETIVSLVELAPVAGHIPTVVRLIRHHNDRGVPFHFVQALNNCTSKTVWCRVLNRPKVGAGFGDLLEDGQGSVGAAIVDNDNFMGDFFKLKFEVEMLNRRGNATLLVPRGNHYT